MTFAAIPTSLAQNKFFGTPNRGVEGAKGNAQIKMLMDENAVRSAESAANEASITALRETVDSSLTTLNDCGTQGMMFGGNHPSTDSQNCLPSLLIEDDGRVVLSGGVQLGDHTACDASAEGTLRYVASQKTVLLCDGTSWVELGAAPSAGGAFNPVTNAALSTTVTSNGIGLSGFFGTRTATVTNGATIIVNGVSQGSSADVKAGDTIALRMTSLGTYGATRSTTFSVSSLSTGWTITTGTVSYSSWSGWGSCSATCGGGTQTRTRTCAFSGGGTVNCADCGGVCSETQSCNTQSCLKWTFQYTNCNISIGGDQSCTPGATCSTPGWYCYNPVGDCGNNDHQAADVYVCQ